MKKLLSFMLAIVCILTLISCSTADSSKGDTHNSAEEKQITVKVVDDKKQEEVFTITTKAEMLGDAVDEINLVQGEEGQYGMFMKTVNGVTVNDANQEWWCLTKNGGEEVMTGIDSTPIADGDTFEITFTVGY
ncbi:MAG: DUF4430 domain-containing protein [Clostridia bacterium]|nr:DUF4430 domain-containing protein [Clostridia bacterium]